MLGVVALGEQALRLPYGIEELLPPYGAASAGLEHHIAPQTAACFVLLGLALVFVRTPKQARSHIADTLTVLLSLLILTLLSGYLFGAAHIFGITSQELVSLPTLTSIALLTVAIGARRAEFGFFSILLGRGIGSRIVRLLFPLMIVLPIFRESLRARLISHGFGVHYITATLASLAVIIAETLVFWLAWRIHNMEMEIHDLSLRDALTGLYNLRGFYLLAEQALRLAQRSGLPFTVIFVDLDNLKRINDTLGHDTGSQFLAETAAILSDAFRESDVLGRVGGDEFAVAGQFGQLAVSLAIERLEAAVERRNAELNLTLPLSFSIGYSISASARHESLDELISRADREMYRNKRERKAGVL